jgi:preprotein translocase SecE subunit
MASLGLYKPGQGYWVRVLTATMAGILVLAGSAWLWAELEKAADWIPRPTSVVTLAAPVAAGVQAGQEVTLLSEPEAVGAAPKEIGKAMVVASQPTSGGGAVVTLKSIKLAAGRDISQVYAVGPNAETLAGLTSGIPTGVPLFDSLYLQAAGVAVLMLLGAGITYWLTGMRPGTVEFLIATDGEMKKVNWSSRRDIIASTGVVIMWSVLLAGGLFVVDSIFAVIFRLIGVLQT